MPTIIDSLVVKLGLSAEEFVEGKRKVDSGLDETGKTSDKTGDKVKKTASEFEKVARNAAKFLAVIGGTMAIKNFLQSTIESNAALDRLSQNLNTGVSTISAWSNATELAGGSVEGLQGTFDMLSKSQTELMLTGQSALIPYFSSLGVSLGDAAGKARPLDDILLDLADRFARMDRTTANNMGRMMGIDQGTLQLLLKGRSEVEAMVRAQKEFGAVSKKQAEEASRLQRVIREGKQTFNEFGRELLSSAMPAIEWLLGAFKNLSTWVRENKEFVKDFLVVLTAGLVGLGAALTPINLTAAAIVGLAAGIALLWQDYQTFKRGGDSLIDWSKWEPGIKAAGDGVRWLRDLLADMMYRAIAAADAMGAIANRDWKRLKFAVGEMKAGTGKEYGKEEPPKPAKAFEGAKATGTPGTAPAAVKPTPATPEAVTIDYFLSEGYSEAQAAGAAANIKRESNYDPAAVGDNGKAYGIGQWHPDRQAEFQKQYGKPIQGSTREDQLKFMHFELSQGKEKPAGDKLRETQTPEDAARVISTFYERPKDKVGEGNKRAEMATVIFKSIQPVAEPTYAEKREKAGIPTPTATVDPVPAPKVTPAGEPMPKLGGVPGAATAAAGAGAAQNAKKDAPVAAAPNISKSVETHIGSVTVNTAATNADDIARDMGKSLNFLFASQANYGLT